MSLVQLRLYYKSVVKVDYYISIGCRYSIKSYVLQTQYVAEI